MKENQINGTSLRVVLASASPRRKELLEQIGIEPIVIPSEVKEEISSEEPSEVIMELSRQKAEWTKGRYEEQSKEVKDETRGKEEEIIVLGADTVVYSEGKILGKPQGEHQAVEMLRELQGKSHFVYTGVTLIRGSKKRTFFEQTEVKVYPMTDEEIQEYIACKESFDKAGAYGIQGRFAAYIEGIRGSYTNVVGLPVGRVYQELKRLMED